jgi:hypothetical protein
VAPGWLPGGRDGLATKKTIPNAAPEAATSATEQDLDEFLIRLAAPADDAEAAFVVLRMG